MTQLTKEKKLKVQTILNEIDSRIPLNYVAGVQQILERKGKRATAHRIRAIRAGRVYDLDVAEALEELSKSQA